MPKYHIFTYGCQMNYSDSERMATYIEALGYKKAKTFKEADLVIFNTCSIRQKAEDRVMGMMINMRKLRKTKPNLIVVIAGCLTRLTSSRYSAKRDKLFNRVREMDIALKTDDMPRLAGLIREVNPKLKIKDINAEKFDDYFAITPQYGSKFQALVPVSTGCDKFCTYCIVPYARGREKSRRVADILAECAELVKNGCKEIILQGQSVNSYGISVADRMSGKFKDVPKGKLPFVYLLEELDKLSKKGLKRVRFTAPHPIHMSDELIDAMARLKTQMPHLHLPVQSGDNRTLKRMNRPYTVEQYEEIIKKFRKKIPGGAVSTDFILGFCGETEDEFSRSLKFFKKMNFEHAYIAQYSERKGTYASKNIKDDVPQKLKKARWDKVNRYLWKRSAEVLNSYVGTTQEVLVEKQDGTHCLGRTPHFKEVSFESKKKILGQMVKVKITGAREWELIGKIISSRQSL